MLGAERAIDPQPISTRTSVSYRYTHTNIHALTHLDMQTWGRLVEKTQAGSSRCRFNTEEVSIMQAPPKYFLGSGDNAVHGLQFAPVEMDTAL